MSAQCLSEPELRGKCRVALNRLGKRIKAGEYIPPPRPQVQKLYVPVSTDTALEHIGQMKSLIKANGTKHRGKFPL